MTARWGLSKSLSRGVANEGAWRTFRRHLLTVHLWLGLILCIPIVVIGVSGSALLVQSDHVSRSFPAATATGPKQTISRAIEVALAAGPANARLGRVDLALSDGNPVTVQLQPPGRRVRPVKIYVDPVSLEVLGTQEVVPRGEALGFLIGIHSFLMMKPYVGVKFVGALGAVMTLMGISGLVLWLPRKGRWRQAFLVRGGARGLPLNLDLHHAAGIWTVGVFLVMSVSGVYLCFPKTFADAVHVVLPSGLGSGEPMAGFAPTRGPLDADMAVASAVSAVPDARAVAVQMPELAGRPIVVFLETTRFGGATRPEILVTFDQATGNVGYVDDPRYHGMAEKVVNLQNALHYGAALGIFWKVIVFVSGFLPLFFAITGFNIWWARRRVTRRVLEAGQIAPAE
jgi:uncharacterized iron-regulated membrane protein